jgi:hypothetical protein
LENHIEVAGRFVEKGLLKYPSEQYFAQFALHYAETYGKIAEAEDILTRVRSRLSYNLDPYMTDLQSLKAGAIGAN